MPLEILQRILGHADIKTTMRYAHVGDVETHLAIDLLSKPLIPEKDARARKKARER